MTDGTHNVYHITSPFSQICVFVVYNKGIVFKNMHFETHFQKFAFSGQQKATVMKMNGQNAKKIPIFSWKRCCINGPSTYWSITAYLFSFADVSITCLLFLFNRRGGNALVPRSLQSLCVCATLAAAAHASIGPTTAGCVWTGDAARPAAHGRPPCCSPAPTESTSRGPSCLCSPVNATTNVATWTMRRSRPNVGCMATCTSLLINILFVQRPAPCLSPSNRVAFRSVTLSRR